MLDDVNDLFVATLTVTVVFRPVPEVWAKIDHYEAEDDHKERGKKPDAVVANTIVTLGKNYTNEQRAEKITPIVNAVIDRIGVDRSLITKIEAVASW